MNSVPRVLVVLTLLSGCAATDSYWDPNGADTGLVVYPQEGNWWCWAATSQAILRWRGVEKTQSQLVSEVFHRKCSSEDLTKECDAPYRLSQLETVGVYPEFHKHPTEEDMKVALTNGWPIAMYYQAYGTTHYRTISGYGATANAKGFIIQDSGAELGKGVHDLTYDELATMRQPWEINSDPWVWAGALYIRDIPKR